MTGAAASRRGGRALLIFGYGLGRVKGGDRPWTPLVRRVNPTPRSVVRRSRRRERLKICAHGGAGRGDRHDKRRSLPRHSHAASHYLICMVAIVLPVGRLRRSPKRRQKFTRGIRIARTSSVDVEHGGQGSGIRVRGDRAGDVSPLVTQRAATIYIVPHRSRLSPLGRQTTRPQSP